MAKNILEGETYIRHWLYIK